MTRLDLRNTPPRGTRLVHDAPGVCARVQWAGHTPHLDIRDGHRVWMCRVIDTDTGRLYSVPASELYLAGGGR